MADTLLDVAATTIRDAGGDGTLTYPTC